MGGYHGNDDDDGGSGDDRTEESDRRSKLQNGLEKEERNFIGSSNNEDIVCQMEEIVKKLTKASGDNSEHEAAQLMP